MIVKPSLAGKILEKVRDVAYGDVLFDTITLAFGLRRKWWQDFHGNLPRLERAMAAGLMREPALSRTVESQMQYTATVLPNLIPSPCRFSQLQPWEMAGNIASPTAIKHDEDNHTIAAEVDLYPLIRHTLGYCSTAAIMGRQFLTDHPSAQDFLFTLDDGFLPLASGVPSWAPLPYVWRAVAARKRLVRDLMSWLGDLKANVPNKDFSDVSEVVRQVLDVLETTRLDAEAQASVILILFWALNANANNMAFWMIIRVVVDPDLLSRLRTEIEPYVRTTSAKQAVHVQEIEAGCAPGEDVKLAIDIDNLSTKCRLLKATYLECNRLHSRPISLRTIVNDITLTDSSPSVSSSSSPASATPTSHRLLARSYLQIPHFLHYTSPSYFPNPDIFRPERFLTTNEAGEVKVDMKTLRPYGGGASMCKGRLFAEKEVLGFVAGFLTCWDVEGVECKGEKPGFLRVPGSVKASATSKPDDDCRVKLSRR
ncbi:MAG: hypothetical protein Q9208_005751 [Pyrenodesmia sp. 3 TL-2023]